MPAIYACLILIHELHVVWLIADENDLENAWLELSECRCTSIDILGKLNDYSRASAGDHIVKWAIFSDDWWHSVCVRNGFITWSTPFAFINYVWRQSWQEEEKMPMELLNAPCCMPQCVYASFICLAFCVPCCIVIVTLLIWSPFKRFALRRATISFFSSRRSLSPFIFARVPFCSQLHGRKSK